MVKSNRRHSRDLQLKPINSGLGQIPIFIYLYTVYKLGIWTATLRQYRWRPRDVLGASEVSANLYCSSRTAVLGRLRDYLRLLMGRTLYI